ncbi:MAG: surface-adhesin E family protein [Nitrosomonadales bacterium]
MYKLACLALLAGLSSNAVAEWMQVGSNQNFTSYADPTTIQKEGNKVMEGSRAKMVSLVDYNGVMTKAGKTYASIKVQHEFDCRQEQIRVLFYTTYAGHMGNGLAVESKFVPGNWRPVSIRSIEEVLWKIACEKK